MTDDASAPGSTTRRRFVLDALGGIAGVTLLPACSAASSTATKRARDDGTGGAPEAGGASGALPADAGGFPDGSGPIGAGGSTNQGGAGGSTTEVGAGGSVSSGGVGTGGAVPDAGTCALYPQQTEGPFYLDLDLLRSDITEGKAGAPLDLEITVLRSFRCAPIANALVDVWQCDADGVYAGFPGQLGGLDTTGQKFLRGTLATGADGRVVFRTIYPGWYPGRTTHIHFKVHLSATTEVTSQLYFPEDVTSSVYQSVPYAARGQKDTSNAMDSIAQTGGMPPVLVMTQGPTAYVGKVTVTVLG